MSAPEMGPRGPDGARKAQKTPETGAQMSPVGTGIQGGSGNECSNTSVFS
jgi:hypothetical protein